MNAYREGDRRQGNCRIGFMQFVWLTVATVSAASAVYLGLLVARSGKFAVPLR
jgi:hypothetical protein